MDFHKKWLNLVLELNNFDPKIIEGAVALSCCDVTKRIKGTEYYISIDPNLTLFLRKNGGFYINILRKSPYSIVYSSPKDLDNIPTEIKEKITRRLEEIKILSNFLNYDKSFMPLDIDSINPGSLTIRFSENSLFMKVLDDVLDNFTRGKVAKEMGYTGKKRGMSLHHSLEKKSVSYTTLENFVKWIKTDPDSYFEKFRGYTLYDFIVDCTDVIYRSSSGIISRSELLRRVNAYGI